MAKLYTKVSLLISRSYYHGGSGLEDQGLVFFRSMEEYTKLAKENHWQSGKSFKSSWCTKPVEFEVWVELKKFKRFESGQTELSNDDVFIPSSSASEVHRVGDWK